MQVKAAELVPLSRLEQAEWNANRVPDEVLAKVRRSLKEFGVVENLVARPHPDGGGRLEVISGNHRLGLYREMGVEKAPVVVVEVDDAHARVLAQTLNRTRGQDDPDAYADLLRDVLAEMSIEDVLGFLPETERSITQILDGLADAGAGADPDDAPELPEEVESKPGEVYELGPHRLICGDSTDPAVLVDLMAGEQADCVWTDPPYGVSYVGKTKDALTIKNDGADGLALFLAAAFRSVDGVLRNGGAVYVAHPPGARRQDFYEALDEVGWVMKQDLVWVKDAFALGHSDYHYRHEPIWYGAKPVETGRHGRGSAGWFGGNDQDSVFEVPRPKRSADHPTMKPIELIESMLRNSCPAQGVVLDPFGGSGSTLIAADRLGRKARLVELDPRYCDVIRRRYEEHAG